MLPRIAAFFFRRNPGTVSSVGLSMPSGFSVAGTPVTGSGTLAVTTALSGIVKANGTGFAAAVPGTDYVARNCITQTENLTITSAHDHAIITNSGASGTVTLTLPATLPAGMELTVVNEAEEPLILVSEGVSQFDGVGIGGTQIESTSSIAFCRMQKTDATWILLSNKGFTASA